MKIDRNKRAFSLIELLITIVVISIVTTLLTTQSFQFFQKKSISAAKKECQEALHFAFLTAIAGQEDLSFKCFDRPSGLEIRVEPTFSSPKRLIKIELKDIHLSPSKKSDTKTIHFSASGSISPLDPLVIYKGKEKETISLEQWVQKTKNPK
jgi:prepilin-type N-terminal cleavage/methylation domain-containing protein